LARIDGGALRAAKGAWRLLGSRRLTTARADASPRSEAMPATTRSRGPAWGCGARGIASIATRVSRSTGACARTRKCPFRSSAARGWPALDRGLPPPRKERPRTRRGL